MSASASNPLGGALPQGVPTRPTIVKPVPPKPRSNGLAWGLAAAAVIAGAGLYLNRDRLAPKEGGGGPTAATVRTAMVAVGDVHRTMRAGGSIVAERFAAISGPRLAGNRGSQSGNRTSSRGVSAATVATTTTTSTSTSVSVTSSNTTNLSSTTAAAASNRSRLGGSAAGGVSVSMTTTTTPTAPADSGNNGAGGAGGGSPRGGGGGAPRGGGGGGGGAMGGGGGAPGGGGGGPGGPGGPGGGGDFALVLVSLNDGGGRVKAGDVVAEFDRVNMLNRIDDYEDSVTQAEMDIKNRKASLALADEVHRQKVLAAKADMEKANLDLKTIEVISDIDAEKFKLAVEENTAYYKQLLTEVPLLAISQKADLHNVELNLQTSKIELQKAHVNADKMILKAPMDGILVMQAIRRGVEFAQVQKGDQVFPGQTFMQVVDPDSMVVNANINQVDAEQLRIGMKATVRLDAYPGLELPGHVYSIGAVPVAGRRPNFMRQIPVRLKLDKSDPRVLPDLSASAEILLESESQATLAPLGAIFEDSSAGKPFVFVRSAAGWTKREVALGLKSNVSVVVKSGLAKGDVVALDMPPQPGAENGAGKSPS